MQKTCEEREEVVRKILEKLPAALGYCCDETSECGFELRTNACVIGLGFARYEADLESITVYDPQSDPDKRNGMALWILQFLRGGQCVSSETEDPYQLIGRTLTDRFGDLLSGDFSIRRQYDQVEGRILDHLFEVFDLPDDHPTRVRFKNYDLQWLDDLERAK